MFLKWIIWGLAWFTDIAMANQKIVNDNFVTREGNRLMVGGKSFHFSGANQYYLFYKSKKMTDDVLTSASALGLNAIRTWAFCDGEWHDGHSLQPEPGIYNEDSFKNLDYAIFRAEQLGIRLIFSLVNNWDAFGGMNAYVKWSKTGRNHDDFYSNPEIQTMFKNYISFVLNRKNTYTGRIYKDDPTVLMWELANEPRVDKTRTQDLYSWVNEMAGFIKTIDPNHLVSTGSEGDQDTDLYLTHQSPHIDIVSFHLYPEDWGLSPEKAESYIRNQIVIAKEIINKPVFCGEFGLRNQSLRSETYQRWYESFKIHNIDGALFWLLSGRRDDGSLYPDYDGFTIYHPQSSAQIPAIQDFNQWMNKKSGTPLDLTPPQLTLEKWTDGEEVRGTIELGGTVSDQSNTSMVNIDIGGASRPAIVQDGQWLFKWNSLESLDRPVSLKITAKDAEGNRTTKILLLTVKNQGYKEGEWDLSGYKEQDDGYNLVYFLTAKNHTNRTETGHFKVRFFLRPEEGLKIGTHYESSQTYQHDPLVSPLKSYHDGVAFLDIDFGFRSIDPGQYLGVKGALSQSDGKMKTNNDWSTDNLLLSPTTINRVLWFKDELVIGGQAP